MRSRTLVSVTEPVNSRATSGASDGSSWLTSSVMIGDPADASRVTRPCPISPSAPVIKMTGFRIGTARLEPRAPDDGRLPFLPLLPLLPFLPRREQHVQRRIDDHTDDEPADGAERQRHDQEGGNQDSRNAAEHQAP